MGKMVSTQPVPQRPPKNGKTEPKRGRVEWKGYVSPTLSSNEKRAYKEWRDNPENATNALRQALMQGYKVSVDFQSKEGAYRASMYCQNADSPNSGWCLSIFSGDWWDAIMRVVYCHSEVLGGDWDAQATSSRWHDDWLE